MTSGTATSALRLTGTQLAQHFRFRCDRQLRYGLSAGGEGVPAPQPRPGMGLLARAGRRFERRKVESLVRRFGGEAVLFAGMTAEGDFRRLDHRRVVEALRDPGAVRWLVQPELVLPDPAAFARRYGLDPEMVEIAPAKPDLVRIRVDDDGRPRFEVIDVKWSRERAVHHFAQVAFYVLVLEEVVRAAGIDGVVEGRWGWLWSRGARGPRRFPLSAYRYHVEAFLRDDLPRVAAGEPAAAAWHLGPMCGGCAFFGVCQAEAEAGDDLARVPGLTPLGRRVLRERGVRTVADLNRHAIRRDTYTGCHALESGEGVLKKRAQALAYRKLVEVEKQTHLLGEAEAARVLVSAEADPVSGTVFALGLRIEKEGGGRAPGGVYVASAGTEAAEREMLGAFLAKAEEAAVSVLAAGSGRRGAKAIHVYVYDRAELELFRGLLQRHLHDAGAQPAIAAMARLLFPTSEMVGLRAAAAAPGTVLVDAVAELFALPVPYGWSLGAVSAALRPAERAWVHQPRDDYAWPLSSQVAFERVHNVWRRRPHRVDGRSEAPEEVRAEIVRTVESKLKAMDSVLRATREQALRARAPKLRMDPGAGPPAASAEPIPDETLETLRIFTELEAAEESLAIRALHTLPSRERARRFECIRGMEHQETREDGSMVFTFDPDCREAKLRPGDFALVLTNDDGETLLETDRKPWLKRRLMVELIDYDLAASPPRLVVAPDRKGFEKAVADRTVFLDRQFVLDRTEADFNTRRVVSTLRHLAAGHGEAAFVLDLLRGRLPAAGPTPLDADAAWAETVGRAGAAVLNAEQAAAWRAAFERSVSVVWGPPGTGKTYLLAWTLIGLAAAARRAGRPFRVLVSAATHRAITNVLVRIARELEGSGVPSPLRAVKLKGRGSAADEDLEGLDVEVIEDERLPAVFAEAEADGMPVVVGSTVWSLWKRMRAASAAGAGEGEGEKDESAAAPVHPMFDVVVIDEASQMKVADALVALSSIRPGGRVVLLGDHRQLAPVIRGSYPRENTLFGSAFAHFAKGFGKLALRESRRFNRALAEYPRRTFYPGLVSMVPEQRLAVVPGFRPEDETDALLWEAFFAPDDAVVFCTYDGYRATARNPFEAHLVARLAALAREGLADPRTGTRYEAREFRTRGFAVISPHRAQNSAILGEMVQRGWAYGDLPVVDTVERMQGNEREMIVVSYAVADREYAEAEADFLLNPNRFNVSITRPRAKLVVFMSEEVLRTLPRDERVMTASMAVKGYPAHAGVRVRVLDLPAPDGGTVRVTCRTR